VFRPGFHALCWAYFGLRLVGTEHIPARGPLLITPNHQTYADPPLVTIPVRRPVYYMAWDRLFDIPGLAWLIRRLRAFPVQVDATDTTALRHAIRLLRAGEAIMIFPEGGRSLNGDLGQFKTGAFRLAVAESTPVLPVTIAGGHPVWPPGRALPRPGRITITYHPVLRPRTGLGPRDAARDLATRTHETIRRALPEASAPGSRWGSPGEVMKRGRA
jgi:1-acyl-sn-glycerol-3-phosphate acyltransferase